MINFDDFGSQEISQNTCCKICDSDESRHRFAFPTHYFAQDEHDCYLQKTPDGDQLAEVGACLLDEKVVEHGEKPREEGKEAADVEAELGHWPRVSVHAGLSLVVGVYRGVGDSVKIT